MASAHPSTPRRIEVLTHVPWEGPGLIAPWAEDRGHSLRRWDLWEGVSNLPEWGPASDRDSMLVVMGGPMGVHDDGEHPWLGPEKAWIREALDRKVPTLGICLGSQLLAQALGASVAPTGLKEIGWYPVFPSGRVVFHWHGDRWDLPPGIQALEWSAACDHQSFVAPGPVVGLQYHAELDSGHIGAMLGPGHDELDAAWRRGEPWVQSATALVAPPPGAVERNRRILHALLDALAGGGDPAAVLTRPPEGSGAALV